MERTDNRILRLSKGDEAGIVGWSKTMIEKQRVPGSSPAWKRKEFFQPCCDPQLIWELVAWHEGNMDAANGISVFDHLVVGLIYSPPTV